MKEATDLHVEGLVRSKCMEIFKVRLWENGEKTLGNDSKGSTVL